MEDKLVIGVELLDYMSELIDISALLTNTQTTADEMLEILNENDTYEGEATDTMETYATSLSAHISRMQMLYQQAASYAYNTYETMYQSDEAMAAWILKQMGETS